MVDLSFVKHLREINVSKIYIAVWIDFGVKGRCTRPDRKTLSNKYGNIKKSK